MSISIDDIASLQDKQVYETSNDQIVLTKEFEKIIHTPEYKVLGFLNGYLYAICGIYIQKYTLDGNEIAQVALEADHASFSEGLPYFYTYIDNTVTKITENLVIEWTKSFEDEIKTVKVDAKGSIYIVFQTSRDIMKYLPDGSSLIYLDDSDNPTRTVRIYDCFISSGSGWIYVIGTEFWDYDNKVQSFIDKYNTKDWSRVDRLIFASNTGVSVDDPKYAYDRLIIKDDDIYIYGLEYLCKMNIKGIRMWEYTMGYNSVTNTFDELAHIEYDDNPITDWLYFSEDLYSSNGHSFGKIGLNGRVLWKLTLADSIDEVDFRFCIYRNKLYTANKTHIESRTAYILSLDNDHVVFKARAGHLIEIMEFDETELYSIENYYTYKLLGDKLVNTDDMITYHPLRHDTGDMVDESKNLILVGQENAYYGNDDNYEYFYLLASNYKIKPNDYSLIFTKVNKPLLTKLSNAIRTKEPYLPDRIHEFIVNLEGEKIDSMRDYDLIRSRIIYSYDRFLLASESMFFTNIITKDLGFTIVTKKDGYEIIRKLKEVYSYVLCKYDEFSLIEEWLKQSGLDQTNIPKYVGQLYNNSLDAINDITVAGIPVQYDIKPYKLHRYTFDGVVYENNDYGTQIFSCLNLPYDKRRCNKKVYIDSLTSMIEKQEIRPVLFFLNGKAIKWSDCTIVRDWTYSYVVIRNTNTDENDLSCIMFPCDIRYGEDNKCLSADVCSTHFYFDKNGLLTDNRSNIAIRMEVIDDEVIGEQCTYSKGYIEVNNEWYHKANQRNIFVFENNILFPESRYYIQDNDKDIFTYLRNPQGAIFKTFYWMKTPEYKGLINKVPNGKYVKDTIIEGTKGKDTSSIDDFRVPFSFKMYRNKLYSDNLVNAVEYIMKYDMSLLVDYYKEQSQIESYVFDGKYILDRVPKDGGWLVMPRHRKSAYDDYIMVFRNNHLYEWYKGIEYNSHNFKIPIFDHINKDDKIEILHFKEVNNSYFSLTVDKKNIDYLAEGLRYDNFLLFGNSPSGKEIYDRFSVETSNYYDIDFTYKNNFDGNKYIGTEIKLADKYYNNKSINVCSKRQFRYMFYNIFFNRRTVNLSPDFKFCHDKSKFMIFHNWKLVSPDDYSLNIMTKESPNKYISVTFNYDLLEGDNLDIFYLPMSYTEIDVSDDIDMDMYNSYGDILINMDKLGYQFDKDLFLLAIDGYKVNYAAVENIDIHRCRVTEDITRDDPIVGDKGGFGLMSLEKPSIKIYQFIQPDELLGKLFSYSDKWSDAIDQLTPSMYETLLLNKTKG